MDYIYIFLDFIWLFGGFISTQEFLVRCISKALIIIIYMYLFVFFLVAVILFIVPYCTQITWSVNRWYILYSVEMFCGSTAWLCVWERVYIGYVCCPFRLNTKKKIFKLSIIVLIGIGEKSQYHIWRPCTQFGTYCMYTVLLDLFICKTISIDINSNKGNMEGRKIMRLI